MKQTLLTLSLVLWAVASQTQDIYNDNARIVSEIGTSWVVSGGNFTLTSTNAVNPATMDNLKIESGASLALTSASCLTVTGTLENGAGITGLTVPSDATNTGSLMILGSTTASGKVERHLTASTWHVIAAPAIENINTFLNRNLVIPKIVGGPDNNRLGMMDYNTTGNAWNRFFPIGTDESGVSFLPGQGFMVRTETPVSLDPTVLNFKGTLTAGATNVTVATGWNCIGNPYTTAILISKGNNAFLTVNGSTKLEKTDPVLEPSHYGVYYWNEAAVPVPKYDIVNEASGAETYAQSGQGFFVKAKTGLVTSGVGRNNFVSFTPAMQVHNTTLEFKVATLPYPSIKLMATSNEAKASTDIKFIDGMSNGLDIGYDAGILKAGATFSVYTKLVKDNGVEFQLQCLPNTGFGQMVIPVGIDSKTGGEIVFSVETVQLEAGCKVILEDKLTNTLTDLSTNTYKAAVAANTAGTGRFYLHTGDIVSGLEDQVLADGRLTAYAKGNKEIRVIGEVGNGAVATLFNGLGKVVMTKKLGAGSLNIIGLPNLSSGLYLLNINDKGTTQTIKVM
ncbi:MAG: T9SS type A sorting domain-containing protein, partial [Mariniphaga sp.]